MKKESKLCDIDLDDIPFVVPFGKYAGKNPDKVPAGYLLFLFEQDWMPKAWPDLYYWIEANFDALQDRDCVESEDDDWDGTTESDIY